MPLLTLAARCFPLCLLLISISFGNGWSQGSVSIKAALNESNKTISIEQEIRIANEGEDSMQKIYLFDWNNAYSSIDSPLAERFAEEFIRNFHLSKKRERGYTSIASIRDEYDNVLQWKRQNDKPDIIEVLFSKPIYPGDSLILNLTYQVKLPRDEFSQYGYGDNGSFTLRYWALNVPQLRNGKWSLDSNLNLDDQDALPMDWQIELDYDKNLFLTTDLDTLNIQENDTRKRILLQGKSVRDFVIYLQIFPDQFKEYQRSDYSIYSDIDRIKVSRELQEVVVERVSHYMEEMLGAYPRNILMVTDLDYRRDPLYGLNLLPSFLRPFSDEFLFEIKLLKTSLDNYLKSTIMLDPRRESWITDGIQIYLLIKYIERYYPDSTMLGSLSNSWALHSYSISKMKFNDQFSFLVTSMERKNLDQPLSMSKDSLIKFNERIAGPNKAGMGLQYLDSYVGENLAQNVIKEFYETYKLKPVHRIDFENLLKGYANKDIQWYFDHYVDTRQRIDYKIKNVSKSDSTITFTLKNKRRTDFPISMFALRNDTVVGKYWFHNVLDEKELTIPRMGADRIVLNYDKVVPEFNQRDNWESLKGIRLINRRFQLRLIKDAEDPHYNQIFLVPYLTYNIYDGLGVGAAFNNKSLLKRPFEFDIRPVYATKEGSLIGGGKINYNYLFQQPNLYSLSAGFTGNTFHYAPSLRYATYTPFIAINFRDPDFRSNKRESAYLRYVNVKRDRDPTQNTDPDYSIFDLRYNFDFPGYIRWLTWSADLQLADDFSKLSLEFTWRKLFTDNRQLTVRGFAGKFLKNETESDYFSFSLDRPTDYLFDLPYFGRSEDTGFVSQQWFPVEGGFKTKFTDPFSNDWIATLNSTYSLWRWIEAYGDVGFLRNKGEEARFKYDSGFRFNLVQDYLEFYFPIYSNLGWEFGLDDYWSRIRFVIAFSPKTLINLFNRRWL